MSESLKQARALRKLMWAKSKNELVMWMRELPVVGGVFSHHLYGVGFLGTMIGILNFMVGILSWMLKSVLYFAIVYGTAALLFEDTSYSVTGIIVAAFLALPLLWNIIAGQPFDPSGDTWSVLFLMRADAKAFVLHEQCVCLLKKFTGYFLAFRILSPDKTLVWAVPLYAIGVRSFVTGAQLFLYDRKKNSTKPFKATIPLAITLAVLAVICVATVFVHPLTMRTMGTCAMIAGALGALGFVYLLVYKNYRSLLKRLITPESVKEVEEGTQGIQNENVENQVELEGSSKSLGFVDDLLLGPENQTGWGAFNRLFMIRHRKLLMRPVLIITAVELVILAALFVVCLWMPELPGLCARALEAHVGVLLMVFYLFDRGDSVIAAMFRNCDVAMLRYRVYRFRDTCLKMFYLRLRYLALVNLLPGLVFALGCTGMFLWGGGTPARAMLLFVCVIFMSLFFSIHDLAMYYLLQPYNEAMEMKAPAMGVEKAIVYAVCIYLDDFGLPFIALTIGLIAVIGIFLAVMSWLVYRKAPDTFRLRV